MAVVDTVLPKGGGPDGESPLFIPKKTVVQYHVYAMHRRKDLYGDDADEFRPERWEKIRPGWEYLPFNGWVKQAPYLSPLIPPQSSQLLPFIYLSHPTPEKDILL